MAEYGGYAEPPEMLARNIMVSARLWVATSAFFYAAFVFTFFYLQQSNSNHMWKPHNISVPITWGSAVLGTNLVGLAAFWIARRGLRHRGEGTWSGLAAISLLLALASAGLQAAEWKFAGVNPNNGGFASVFLTWTGFAVLNTVGLCYWLSALVFEPVRAKRAFGSSAVLQSSAAALEFMWVFFGIASVIEYVLLYFAA